MKRTLAPLALVPLLALAACGGSSSPSSASAGTRPSAASSASTAAPDAASVAERLKAGGVPIVKVFTVTAENDPNHLLGRPGGYSSKVVVTDSRVPEASRGDADGVDQGAAVEVFDSPKDAQARADYIGSIRAKAPTLANEYDYVHGAVLLRVTGLLTKAQAATYDAALS